MQLSNLIKQPVDTAIAFVKKLLHYYENQSMNTRAKVLSLYASNIFLWLNFKACVPDAKNASSNFSNPKTFSDFIITRNRKKLIQHILAHIKNRSTLIVQKSKGLGATTCALFVAFWHLLFKPNSRFVFVCPSYKGKAFSSSATSLYNLLKHNYPMLVPHLLFRRHCNTIRFFSVENMKNGSVILFLPSHMPVSLSDLFPDDEHCDVKAVIFDEMAFQKEADSMWQSLDNTDITRIAISCANGKSNLFYELVSEANFPLLTLHWFHEPHCDEAWYKQMCENNEVTWVEQYINIDYNFKSVPAPVLKARKKRAEHRALVNEMIKSCEVVRKYYRPEPKRRRNTAKNNNAFTSKPARKPHRNPKNVTAPTDFNTALNKFLTTAAPRKKLNLNIKTTQAVKEYKVKLASKESHLIVDLPGTIELLNRHFKPKTLPQILEIGESSLPLKPEITEIKKQISSITELVTVLIPATLKNFWQHATTHPD